MTSLLEIRAERRQKSISVEFSFATVFAEEIRGRMEEKGLMEEDWNDRDKWKKII